MKRRKSGKERERERGGGGKRRKRKGEEKKNVIRGDPERKDLKVPFSGHDYHLITNRNSL